MSERPQLHSIYEIEGAKKCAIEFRFFSKTAGFTQEPLGSQVPLGSGLEM